MRNILLKIIILEVFAKNDQICTYFKIQIDAAKNRIDNLFSNFDCQRAFPCTGQNTVISPNFLVRKLCGKPQFPHSFLRQGIRWNYCIFRSDRKDFKNQKKKMR